MANEIKGNIGTIYFLKSGQVKDPSNLSSFHPLSNVNLLRIHIEDGGTGENSYTYITYKSANTRIPASHKFPIYLRGLVNHTISGENAPRTFTQYLATIPDLVARYNINSKEPMDVSVTVVQESGVNFIGTFATLTLLNAYATPEEDNIAYVTDNQDYGYYEYDGDSWQEMSAFDIQRQISRKQYNLGYITLQGGFNLDLPITTLEDAQYKIIWQELEDINSRFFGLESTVEGFELDIAGKLSNVVFEDTGSVQFTQSREDDVITVEADVSDSYVKSKAREEVGQDITDLQNNKATKMSIPQGSIPYRNGFGLGEPNTHLPVNSSQTPTTVALRKATGAVATADPSDNEDAVNLETLNTKLAEKAKKPTHFEDENIETIYVVKDDGTETRAKGSKGIVNDAYVKRDSSGKVLVEDGASGKEAINYSQFEPLTSGKEDKSNKVTDFSVIDNIKYPTTKAVKTETDKKVNKTQTIIGIDLQDNILIGEFKTALGNATQVLAGLMSAQDKTHLDNLVSLLDTNDMNSVVDTIGEILQIFENYPEGANILETLNDKVDKIEGKGLSENDYTDIDKNKVNLSYIHSEIVDGSNPHNTKFVNIADKPTTRDGYGITDVYTKPETYTQLEINNLLDNLSAVKGLKSTLLTPTELVNGNTIATNLLTNNGAYVVFTATDTLTGEIDSDTVPVSTIITGKKFVFFDNQEIVFTIGETNSTFETSEDITLKINLLYLDSENVQAAGVDFDGSLTNYLLNQENVQSAISKLDEELKTTNDNKVDKVTGKGLSTEDYTTTEKNKLSGIEAGAEVNVQSDWTQEVNTADDYIKNKPAIPTKVSDLTNDTGYITGYTETDPIFTAWDKSTGISITKSQVSDLIEATQALSGLMSATDKQRLDVLHALLEEDTSNNVVDSINEVLEIFNNYPEGADLVTALAGKVDKNVDIVAGTKTKITYDSKGLVTGGSDLVPSDIGAVEEALNDGKTYARKNKGWVELQSGFLPDEETIILNGNDELEATNVAIWRYE